MSVRVRYKSCTPVGVCGCDLILRHPAVEMQPLGDTFCDTLVEVCDKGTKTAGALAIIMLLRAVTRRPLPAFDFIVAGVARYSADDCPNFVYFDPRRSE